MHEKMMPCYPININKSSVVKYLILFLCCFSELNAQILYNPNNNYTASFTEEGEETEKERIDKIWSERIFADGNFTAAHKANVEY